MLLDDFATWTEKVRRKMLRDYGVSESIYNRLPSGVPISLEESRYFLDALLGLDIPSDIREKAVHWRVKLSKIVG